MSSWLPPSLVIRSRHSRTFGSPTSQRSTPTPNPKGHNSLPDRLTATAEIRCYLRDPDGYLIEIGQATGMLRAIYADQHAEDN
jgi:hypothetical protein